jgi:hypothetical protein
MKRLKLIQKISILAVKKSQQRSINWAFWAKAEDSAERPILSLKNAKVWPKGSIWIHFHGQHLLGISRIFFFFPLVCREPKKWLLSCVNKYS